MLPIAIATVVLVAAFSGIAYARLLTADSAAARGPVAAPMHAPVRMPARDASSNSDAWGYRSSAAIGRSMAAAPQQHPSSAGGASSASATVTVTATVLPVVFLVFDEQGDLQRIVTNTDTRTARNVIFLPRTGSESGAPVTLDAMKWRAVRAALASAHAGTGTIWAA